MPPFLLKRRKQSCSSSVRFMPFRVLQEYLVEVFTLGIPTSYTIISSATWDTLFRRSADVQSPSKFVCESNMVAPLGLAEVPLLYRLAWYRTSKPGWSNKRGWMLRPWKLFQDISVK